MHVRHKTLLLLVSPLLLLVAAAYIQWGTVGLPPVLLDPTWIPATTVEPYGFPAWLRITHYVNLLFLVLMLRTGAVNAGARRSWFCHGGFSTTCRTSNRRVSGRSLASGQVNLGGVAAQGNADGRKPSPIAAALPSLDCVRGL